MVNTMQQSWFGSSDKARAALEAAGAAKGPGGEFLSRGPAPFFGIGGDEVIISTEVEVQINGEWVKAVSVLPRGVQVMVIG